MGDKIVIDGSILEMFLPTNPKNDQINKIFQNRDFPVKVKYRLARLKDRIDREMRVYAEKKQEIVNENAEKDDDGNIKTDENRNIVLKDVGKFSREMTELISEKIELDIDKIEIKLDDLPDDFSADDINFLMNFAEIKEGDE